MRDVHEEAALLGSHLAARVVETPGDTAGLPAAAAARTLLERASGSSSLGR
ncbi:hypothetical protein [Nonomuraea sp. LPB2021202275-12-8]|uniref:hypothetical protein n=1 Tax=Nonomuraea sp. LPB2021202275-12-8 TaxID=3120159 RepID=UPI00300C774C